MRTHGRHLRAPFAVVGLAWLAVAAGACSSPSSPTPTPSAPTLTCPSDITAVSNDGSPIGVTYTTPAAAGGSAPVTVSCSPRSGSSFSPGITAITCVATDTLGRNGTCGFGVRVSVPPKLQKTNFLAFGDSMTQGEVTVPQTFKLVIVPAAAYPTRLEVALRARYTAQTVSVANAGNGGEYTWAGVTRLGQEIATVRPDAVLLMEGANDLFGGNPASIDIAASNLRTMVTASKNSGATVFLANLPPQCPSSRGSGGYPLVPIYNSRLASIAAEQGVGLVDVYTAFGGVSGSLIGVDCLHPSEAGYQKIADTFFERIRATLETPGVLTTAIPSQRLAVPEPEWPARDRNTPRERIK